MKRPKLEICVASLSEAQSAERAGADRLELNSGLPLGGLTPSAGLVERVLGGCRLPVMAMARPRPGGFCYGEDDWATLLADVRWMIGQGVHGIAFGCLRSNRSIDWDRVQEVRQLSNDVEFVFHRAFDLVEDWKASLDGLAEAGIDRIMTSGLAPSVPEGLRQIKEMVVYAQGRVEIIPAGGINTENLTQVLKATSCNQLHGTFSTEVVDPGYADGRFRFASNDQLRVSNYDKVVKAVAALESWSRKS